jgi:hypothetical protein
MSWVKIPLPDLDVPGQGASASVVGGLVLHWGGIQPLGRHVLLMAVTVPTGVVDDGGDARSPCPG